MSLAGTLILKKSRRKFEGIPGSKADVTPWLYPIYPAAIPTVVASTMTAPYFSSILYGRIVPLEMYENDMELWI